MVLQNSVALTYVLLFIYEHNAFMYIHRTKLTGSNEKTTDEGLSVIELTRCMSILLFS